jgi:hypothetical protein
MDKEQVYIVGLKLGEESFSVLTHSLSSKAIWVSEFGSKKKVFARDARIFDPSCNFPVVAVTIGGVYVSVAHLERILNSLHALVSRELPGTKAEYRYRNIRCK